MKRSLTAAEFRALNSGKRNSRKNLLAKAAKVKKEKVKCGKCGGWINPTWTRGDGDYRHCECNKDPREKNFPVDEPLTEGEKRMEEYYRERKR